MIYSMTGFGRGTRTTSQYQITVEISTVNRKQFDCSINLPRELLSFDIRLQSRLRQVLSRGAVRVNVSLVASSVAPDTAALAHDITQLKALAQAIGLPGELALRDLIANPDFFKRLNAPTPTEALYTEIEATLDSAIEALQAMRAHEGKAICGDLSKRLDTLAIYQKEIATIAPEIPKLYQEALRKRIEELVPGSVTLSEDALAKEVALCADRCDISEELTRLTAHIEHARSLLAGETSCGRSLDFLCQELFREINTCGSKCNNAPIAHTVIDFKTLLETFREQVQNLE